MSRASRTDLASLSTAQPSTNPSECESGPHVTGLRRRVTFGPGVGKKLVVNRRLLTRRRWTARQRHRKPSSPNPV